MWAFSDPSKLGFLLGGPHFLGTATVTREDLGLGFVTSTREDLGLFTWLVALHSKNDLLSFVSNPDAAFEFYASGVGD